MKSMWVGVRCVAGIAALWVGLVLIGGNQGSVFAASFLVTPSADTDLSVQMNDHRLLGKWISPPAGEDGPHFRLEVAAGKTKGVSSLRWDNGLRASVVFIRRLDDGSLFGLSFYERDDISDDVSKWDRGRARLVTPIVMTVSEDQLTIEPVGNDVMWTLASLNRANIDATWSPSDAAIVVDADLKVLLPTLIAIHEVNRKRNLPAISSEVTVYAKAR